MGDVEPLISDAIDQLKPNAKWEFSYAGDHVLVWLDEVQTQPTQKAIDDKLAELKAEWDALAWNRNRRGEYPSTGDQWDMIYKDNKNSTTTHADAVEAVKTKWPKDNSGPVE
jgi:hypothetical protein